MATRIISKSETGVTFPTIIFFFLFILCVHAEHPQPIIPNPHTPPGEDDSLPSPNKVPMSPESEYLVKLQKALNPAPSNWSQNTAICDWSGVECNQEGKVYALELRFMSLQGTIPSDLNNSLTDLNQLILEGNSLSGPLPSLSGLSMLKYASLDYNNFTSIPDHCFQGLSSLESLTLGNNINLQPWNFPLDLARSSSKLSNLELDGTNLMGTLPAEICISFPKLTALDLSYNKLTGPLPDFANCTTLSALHLQDNLLTGLVPPSLTNLSSLFFVGLDRNYFQGPFPANYNVSHNGFCLDHAGPCDNRVTTLLQIAAGFGYPLLLATSWPGNNPCQNWSFVVCIQNKITTLNFTKLNLTGTISPAFRNLTDLRELYLSANHLSGSIPESLTGLPQLKVLDVSNNNLSGNIPNFSSNVTLITKGNVLLRNASHHQPSAIPPSKASFPLSLIAAKVSFPIELESGKMMKIFMKMEEWVGIAEV